MLYICLKIDKKLKLNKYFKSQWDIIINFLNLIIYIFSLIEIFIVDSLTLMNIIYLLIKELSYSSIINDLGNLNVFCQISNFK